MPKFRKNPIVIEAHQWLKNGDHPEDDCHMITESDPLGPTNQFLSEGKVVRRFRRSDTDGDRACEHCGRPMNVHGWIDTLEAGHNVCPGDWIITGIAGEKYPCKDKIFQETYEAVE